MIIKYSWWILFVTAVRTAWICASMSSNFLLWCLTTLFILFPLSKSASMLSIVKRLNRGKEIPNIIEKDSHCVAEKLGRFWNGGKTMVFWDRGRLELCCIHISSQFLSLSTTKFPNLPLLTRTLFSNLCHLSDTPPRKKKLVRLGTN